MAQTFFMPRVILSGESAAGERIRYMPATARRALVITAQSTVRLGLVSKITEVLDGNSFDYIIYDKVDYEPTDKIVEEGVRIYKEERCDHIIAVGGGSVLDVMKAVGLLASNGGKISDYVGSKSVQNGLPFMAAVPTTAGTGSEATQFTIITDTENDVKMLIGMPALIPDLVLLIPEMTLTVPGSVTVATGMDALVHAIEAYISRKAQPLTDTFAESAVRRIFRFLPAAFRDGNNQEARKNLAYAALEAGIAFSNSSVTLIHGMSRPIGALFHIPHGLSNAMLINECMAFMADSAYEELGRLAVNVGAAEKCMSDREKSECFLKVIGGLCKECKIPSLAEYGIDKEVYFKVTDKMAEDALASGSPQNLKKRVCKEDIINLYHNLW